MMSYSEKELKRTYLDYLIAAQQTPTHLKHIMIAMRDYGISFFTILQNSPRFETEQLEHTWGFVAVIGDDTNCSMGPDNFNRVERVILKQLVDKCSYVAIISSEIVVGLYDFMAQMAGQRQTGALIIETRPEHELQWAERIRALSPHIPLVISTPYPEKMSRYVWADSSGDATYARKRF